MILAADTASTIAIVIAVILAIGWVAYVLGNLRRTRPALGAEIELAPNRRPYYSDEELEGRRLEQVQLYGVLMLIVLVLGLPLYWLNEPSRQAGAIEGYDKRFAEWGSRDFATTADGGFNCAGCHGGMKAQGGVAPYTITNPNTGEVQAVNWSAPALNTVLYRFSEDEVKYIIVYGRPFSPMSPWGIEGGGPMNAQQIDNLVQYLLSIQIPMEGCPEDTILCTEGNLPADIQKDIQDAAEKAVADGRYKTLGEALFNLDLNSGAYNCARCHTTGWSYGEPEVSGGGAMGPNLTGGSEVRQFPNADDQIDFIEQGSQQGRKYGQQGQGTGRMPGFLNILTTEQIQAIVDYERNL